MIIYKITNKLNGKVYIGQTTRSLAARIHEHIHKHSRVGKDMVKYGRDNLDISVIDNAETKEELDDLEIFWIAWKKIRNKQKEKREYKEKEKAFEEKLKNTINNNLYSINNNNQNSINI